MFSPIFAIVAATRFFTGPSGSSSQASFAASAAFSMAASTSCISA
jgi:hypothetical protein